jgi:tetratricopeptide (TPR) repeat protein
MYQVVAFALIIVVIYVLLRADTFSLLPLLIGAALYFLWSSLAQRLFLRDHRIGILFLRSGVYPQAIQAFERSEAQFAQLPWLDRFRWITLLSPSAIGYREMALNNIGYAYLQLGKYAQARASYQKLLEQFPDGITSQAAAGVIARIDARAGTGNHKGAAP